MRIISNIFKKTSNERGYVLLAVMAVTAMLPTMTYVLMQFIGTSTAANMFFKAGLTKQGMNVTKSLIIGTAKDVDSDGHFESLKEGSGNTLPLALSVRGTDEFGTQIKYCSWDLGSLNLADAGYSQNNSAPPITSPSPLMARLISAGSDKTFQTSCNDSVAKGDDIVVDIYESDVLYSNGGNGGWTNDGSSVRLINSTENVSIGGVIPASGSKLDVVGNSSVSGTHTAGAGFYTYDWFRNWNSGQGLYNQANETHLYSTPAYWKITAGGNAAGGLQFLQGYESNLMGYTYWDASGFGLLHKSGGWAVRTNPSSTELFNNVTIRSGSLYFDQANPYINASSYYVAPGGAYFNNAPVYAEAMLRARGGLLNDTGSFLELYGGTTGKTHLNGNLVFPDGTEQATAATPSIPVILADGDYALGTDIKIAFTGSRRILLFMQFSGGQGGNAPVNVTFKWGINGYSNIRPMINGGVNYQVAFDPSIFTSLAPAGSGAVWFRVDQTNLSPGYGSPAGFRLFAMQL